MSEVNRERYVLMLGTAFILLITVGFQCETATNLRMTERHLIHMQQLIDTIQDTELKIRNGQNVTVHGGLWVGDGGLVVESGGTLTTECEETVSYGWETP